MTDAAQRPRASGLDGHAPAAAVAGLAAAEFMGDEIEIQRESRRNAFKDRHERLTVRLAGCQKPQHRPLILSEKSAHSGRRALVMMCRVERRRSCTEHRAWI